MKSFNATLNESATSLWDCYWSNPSIENRNALAEHYWPSVIRFCKKAERKMPIDAAFDGDDLVGFCAPEFVKLIERFRPDHKTQFTTYMQFRLAGAINDGLRKLDWAPTIERTKAKRGEASIPGIQSLHTPLMGRDSGNVVELIGVLEGGSARPSERLDSDAAWTELLKSCSDRERQLFSLYYHDDKTFAEIGVIMGVHESRVSQIHTACIARLRRRDQHTEPPAVPYHQNPTRDNWPPAEMFRSNTFDASESPILKRPRIRWSYRNTLFLIENSCRLTCTELAKRLDTKCSQIIYHTKRLGLHLLKSPRREPAPPKTKQGRHRAKLRSLGLCEICGKPPSETQLLCATCREKRRKIGRQAHHRRRLRTDYRSRADVRQIARQTAECL